MSRRTASIQAGGASRRMGRDKGLVPLAGVPLVERVVARVRRLTDDILLTTNRPEGYRYLGLKMAQDEHPRAGALEGLHTALAHANGDVVLVVGCDMPFLGTALLEHLLRRANAADIIIPQWNDRLQPLCAVYQRSCLGAVEQSLARGDKRLIAFHDLVEVLTVEQAEVSELDPDGLSFFNVNTPADLALAERILAERSAADEG